MRKVAILQARMNSSRLPGKVLMDLEGKSLLVRQLRRLKVCSTLNDIVVATTDQPSDDALVQETRREGVGCFRGSETDVLSRMREAARAARADLVVRLTADCPLMDSEVVDRVVGHLAIQKTQYDYVSNVVQRTYPRGLDVEAFMADTLERLHRMAVSKPAREHVTFYILNERPNLFSVKSIVDEEDNSRYRWTVDTQDDLTMIRRIYRDLYLNQRRLSYRDILLYLKHNPDVVKINSHIQQKVA